MQRDPYKQIRLDEGHIQRGASGQGPKTPKPVIIPKGQGKKDTPPTENTKFSLADYFLPFGGKLSGDNRWIKLA